MKSDAILEIRLGRRGFVVLSLALTLLISFLVMPGLVRAQKAQESVQTAVLK